MTPLARRSSVDHLRAVEQVDAVDARHRATSRAVSPHENESLESLAHVGAPVPSPLIPRQEKPLAPATADGLRQVLTTLDTELRFNVRLSQVEARDAGGVWLRLTVRAEARLRERIAEEFDEQRDDPYAKARRLTFSASRWLHLVNVLVADREVDPFVDWLESLAPWNGVPRLDGWLGQCFQIEAGVPPSLLPGRRARFCWPPCGGPTSRRPSTTSWSVLVGPQGIGKSSPRVGFSFRRLSRTRGSVTYSA